jgi:hypothetical protein
MMLLTLLLKSELAYAQLKKETDLRIFTNLASKKKLLSSNPYSMLGVVEAGCLEMRDRPHLEEILHVKNVANK